MPKWDMKNYTDVNERRKLARDVWQDITIGAPVMLTEVAGYVTATVTLRDGRSCTQVAGFRLDLQGQSAQAGFPIEDAATSALGRALGEFGYGTDSHFPSRQEMEQVAARETTPEPAPAQPVDKQRAMFCRIRALWAQERALGGTNPVDETATDLLALTLPELEALGRAVRARVDALGQQPAQAA